MGYLTLVPAYGRDYKSKAEVEKDWKADKDFQISNAFSPDDGRYANRSGLEADPNGPHTVNIRYKGLRQVAVIKVKR